MKTKSTFSFHFLVLLVAIGFFYSCCNSKENCPTIKQDEWLEKFSDRNLDFESTKGGELTILFQPISTMQDVEPNCNKYNAWSPCNCTCLSSSELVGEILNGTDSNLTGPIQLIYEEISDINDGNKGNKSFLEIKFITSKGYFSNPFSSEYPQIDQSTDTVGKSNRIVNFEDYTQTYIYNSPRASSDITAIFFSENEGLIGFEVDSSEKYFKIN